jgi:hypothetical protein
MLQPSDNKCSRFETATASVCPGPAGAVSSPSGTLRFKELRAAERRPADREIRLGGVTSGARLHAGTITAKRGLARVRWWHGERFGPTEQSS